MVQFVLCLLSLACTSYCLDIPTGVPHNLTLLNPNRADIQFGSQVQMILKSRPMVSTGICAGGSILSRIAVCDVFYEQS
jgi:hypothetical protein